MLLKSRILTLFLVGTAAIVFAFGLLGCSGNTGSSPSGAKVTTLKVGVLSLVSALPLFVADQEGYFKEEGLNVELVTFNSALEQDAALQAGELDGYFSDPINTIVMIKGGVDISVINSPYKADPKNRMFAIVAAPNSAIKSVADLKGVKVAVAFATITEYLQDKMLEKSGFKGEEIASQEIKQIPIRLQMLLGGQIEAALLPEPLVSLAEFRGARVIADDSLLGLAETVIALDNSLMKQDPTLKDRFLKGLEKAVTKANIRPQNFGDTLLTRMNIPAEIRNTYVIPQFPAKALPSNAEINEIQEWLIKKGIMDQKLPFDKIVK